MNFLITGGCGFLGTNLVKRLISNGGNKVRIIDNLSIGSRDELAAVCDFDEISTSASTLIPAVSENGRVQLIVGDIQDENLAITAAAGIDVMVHFAANTGVATSVENPRMDCVTNCIGTLNYLEAARHQRVRRFVFASSSASVGEVKPPIHEEMAPHPVSPYGAGKLAGEGYCSAYFRTYEVDTVILRFGNVYGPSSRHKSSVIAKFINRALKGLPLEIYGDGAQTRDFIYVDDLIEAVWRAAVTPGIGGETFQIATSAETSVRELLGKLMPALTRQNIPLPSVQFSAPRVGDVRCNFSDTTKAHERLGWRSMTSIDTGIEKTVRWFVDADHTHSVTD